MNIKIIKAKKLFPLSIIAAASVLVFFSLEAPTVVAVPATTDQVAIESEILRTTTKKTTTQVLGFESKHGTLPASLRGTTLDNALKVDEEGHLLMSSDIKDVFDYFLSAISEEDLDTILLRVDEYLSHYLQEPALSESKAVLAQYIEFKYSLMTLEQEMSKDLSQMSQQDKVDGGYLDFLRKQMDQRNVQREQYLDPAVYEAFYAEEQRYDEYTYSRLLVNSNKSLSASERLEKITEYQSTLPEDVRQSIKQTQITDELKLITEKVLAEGGDQQQVRELRREMLGDEAVQRFDELDQQRAQWQSRINEYLTQRANILSNQGLATDELSIQVDALRASLFDELEQLRVRSIERHAEA